MKAIRVPCFGGVEVLEYIETENPQPAADEVLIHVEAAGINYADVMMRYGMYPGGPRPPYIPGFEIAGKIVELGSAVNSREVGTAVMAMAPTGGYAEYAKVHARATMPLPAHFTMCEGAAFPVTYQTAYHALCTYGQVQEGQSVLIHAAGGGVGTAAVQIAKQLGVHILATASSDKKLERLQEMGCDVLINYSTQDFVPIVMEATGGRGCEVILESVGGEVFRRSFKCLATMGRMVVFGIASGELEIVHPRELLFKNHSVMGLHLSALAQNEGVSRPAIRQLSAWVEERRLTPNVGHTYPLADVAKAHQFMESRKSFGKIVLLPC